MIQLEKRELVPFFPNPFGLDLWKCNKRNKEKWVQIHLYTYILNGIKIATNIYTPKNYHKSNIFPAIVIAVPNGSVKEEAAGLYCTKIGKKRIYNNYKWSYFFGESEGTPRQQNIPYYRIEDIRGIIDAISTFPKVDSKRIYGLGICGDGGYMLSASQMDKRIKKVTTLSMFNTGAVRRERFQNSQVDTVLKRLHDVANIREKEIKEDHLIYNQNMSDMDAPIGSSIPFWNVSRRI